MKTSKMFSETLYLIGDKQSETLFNKCICIMRSSVFPFKNNADIRLGLLTPELSKYKKKGMDKKISP